MDLISVSQVFDAQTAVVSLYFHTHCFSVSRSTVDNSENGIRTVKILSIPICSSVDHIYHTHLMSVLDLVILCIHTNGAAWVKCDMLLVPLPLVVINHDANVIIQCKFSLIWWELLTPRASMENVCTWWALLLWMKLVAVDAMLLCAHATVLKKDSTVFSPSVGRFLF